MGSDHGVLMRCCFSDPEVGLACFFQLSMARDAARSRLGFAPPAGSLPAITARRRRLHPVLWEGPVPRRPQRLPDSFPVAWDCFLAVSLSSQFYSKTRRLVERIAKRKQLGYSIRFRIDGRNGRSSHWPIRISHSNS